MDIYKLDTVPSKHLQSVINQRNGILEYEPDSNFIGYENDESIFVIDRSASGLAYNSEIYESVRRVLEDRGFVKHYVLYNFRNKENPKTGRKGWHWIRAFKQEDVNKVYRRLMKSNK